MWQNKHRLTLAVTYSNTVTFPMFTVAMPGEKKREKDRTVLFFGPFGPFGPLPPQKTYCADSHQLCFKMRGHPLPQGTMSPENEPSPHKKNARLRFPGSLSCVIINNSSWYDHNTCRLTNFPQIQSRFCVMSWKISHWSWSRAFFIAYKHIV